jgi:signal transduction histidine kinase
LSASNKIIFECLDEALSNFEFVDKKVFYTYLADNYKVDYSRFADKFEIVHTVLKELYGVNHYRIERAVIRILNDRVRKGLYQRTDEVSAFGSMVNVFMAETQKNIARNKQLAILSSYTKALEAQVKDANEKLKTAERLAAIGETAAMVGHDIRNPLQAIVGELFLERQELMSLHDQKLKSNLTDSINSIEENVFYINKIVSDLQDFAKPLQGTIEKQGIDVNQVISEALSLIPLPKNIAVEISIAENSPMIMEGNFQMLKRALTNLIMNAIQAMPDGGKLSISAYYKNGYAEIAVEDTGVGISEEVKTKIFRPLVTTKSKGQGLGLAVVKRLVEAQGGKVNFESQVGVGSRFFLQLPLK